MWTCLIIVFLFELLVASNGSIVHNRLQAEKEKIHINDDCIRKSLMLLNNGNNHSDTNTLNSSNHFGSRNISEGDISVVGLKRRVGFISGTALIVGTMIG